jgi:hypothetical protein
LPEDDHVRLEVFDVLGRSVTILVDGIREAGDRSVLWNGRDRDGREAASGIYFYRFRAGEFTETRKMILLR